MTPSHPTTVTGTKPQDRVYKITPVEAGLIDSSPEFIRLPKPGDRCRYTSLSRTTLVELLSEVQHVRLRKPGARKSIVLIHLKSLRAYLEARMSRPKAHKKQQQAKGAKDTKQEALA